jgi:universal stress protein E
MPPLTIRSILLATDLTPESDALIGAAARFAHALEADLHVVHVLEHPRLDPRQDRSVLAMQKRTHVLRRSLAAQLDRSLPDGFRVAGSVVAHGSASTQIVRQAAELDVDLVILGRHRERGVGDRLRGATVERVLATATVPCLVLNGSLDLPLRSIVLPIDLSAPSLRALDVAASWQARLGGGEGVDPAHLSLLRVVSTSPAPDRNLSRGDDEVRLAELVRDLRSRTAETTGAPDVTVVVGAEPSRVILSHAEERNADLIVMGTHGDGTAIRLLLGSVSSEVHRRAPCSVLMVPPANRALPPAVVAEMTMSG